MNEFTDRFDNVVNELKQDRDELKVKLHLAKLETSEEWQKIEHKMMKLESKAKEVGGATAQASGEMGAAVKLLAQEIRDGFKDIARHF